MRERRGRDRLWFWSFCLLEWERLWDRWWSKTEIRRVQGPKKSSKFYKEEAVINCVIHYWRASISSGCSCGYRCCLPHCLTDIGGLLHHVRHLLSWDMLLLFPSVRNNSADVLLAVNWELTGLQEEITVNHGYQLMFPDFGLHNVIGWKNFGVGLSTLAWAEYILHAKRIMNQCHSLKVSSITCRHMARWHFLVPWY